MNLGPYSIQIDSSGRRRGRPGRLLSALAAVAVALPVAVAPAFAGPITGVSQTVTPAGTGLTAQYDVTFTPGTTGATTVTVAFPLGTTVSAAPAAGSITVNPTTCAATGPTTVAGTFTAATATAGPTVTLTTPSTLTTTVTCVRFLPSAGIKNPSIANSYKLSVSTSTDTTAVASTLTYQIFSAATGGSLSGVINVAPPAILSVTLSAPAAGFTTCADSLANLDHVTAVANPTTGLQNGGACGSAPFTVTVNTSGAASVSVQGSKALPNAPSTGNGWTLAATTGVDQYTEGLGVACTAPPTPLCVTPTVLTLSSTAYVADTNFAAITTAGTFTATEGATISAPTVSDSAASSNPTTGFASNISWLVISAV